ncbi:MAG: acetyl-CoA carboxylase carboxyltransferase subunit alpha [Chlorobi bacterium]|nr:acetyl-CoA carboxylase carboxyltransferase subunit alpha [Chlorobiota bacterium]
MSYILDFEKPILELEKKVAEMKSLAGTLDLDEQIADLERRIEELRVEIYSKLTRWQRVQLARHPERPYTLDYLAHSFDEFIELHGDRCYRDDPAIVSGLARIGEHKVIVVGHQKGRDTKTNLLRNFGMPNPEGYRKARRVFELAEKFGRPVVTFLDTPGAFPGIEAEERGQAEAIARNLFVMASLRVPIIVVIIGEGASGGALGIGVGDRILMLENAWYSVIAPESCSSILWRSWDYKEQAAEALQLCAHDLLRHGIIDRVVSEPIGGAHRDPEMMFRTLRQTLLEELPLLRALSPEELVRRRHEKFARMGVWEEVTTQQ